MIGKDLRDIHSALAIFPEGERTRHQRAGIALAHHDIALPRERLSGVLRQRRFGIERIDMAHSAAHEK
jgi:hypothetical protein